MRGRFIWVLLALIALVVIALIASGDRGTLFGIGNEKFASAAYYSLWGLVVAAGLVGMRRSGNHILKQLAIWLCVVVVLVAGYQYRYELQDFASRVTAGFVPGSPISGVDANGRTTVTLDKLSNGHFGARAAINGVTVAMIVDTGATSTVLTTADARRAGFNTRRLSYFIPVMTANGQARAAAVTVRDFSIGRIRRHDMRVLVAEPGALGESLLGMDFIGSLPGFSVRGDRMILID